ncbi:MAG: hypothetical protein RPR97_11655 [Colwellia sp.]
MDNLINFVTEYRIFISLGVFIILSLVVIHSDIGKAQQEINKKKGIDLKINTFW